MLNQFDKIRIFHSVGDESDILAIDPDQAEAIRVNKELTRHVRHTFPL